MIAIDASKNYKCISHDYERLRPCPLQLDDITRSASAFPSKCRTFISRLIAVDQSNASYTDGNEESPESASKLVLATGANDSQEGYSRAFL